MDVRLLWQLSFLLSSHKLSWLIGRYHSIWQPEPGIVRVLTADGHNQSINRPFPSCIVPLFSKPVLVHSRSHEYAHADKTYFHSFSYERLCTWPLCKRGARQLGNGLLILTILSWAFLKWSIDLSYLFLFLFI